ncbi:Cyclic nucleotide-gated cation channel alpha-3 [Stylophora pistillata]|uniref:Cyclic nucleotide-gated cation channel alpha-3 n=1 Tax=Stylophora pistillata TaxID=50429 RepID=A0A2B4S124_STYPI|nr:Cyclic nucleotide-gated cation channel alpha-3 [Stylophora pistillata]
MANLWSVAREWFLKQNPRRNVTPRKISTVLEILQNQEEAKDHVYYDALRRISASKDERPTNGCAKINSLQDIQEEDREQAPLTSRRSIVKKYLLSIRQPIGKVLRSERLVVDPEDDIYYIWMGVIAATVIYNFCTVILRIAFTESSEEVKDPVQLSEMYSKKRRFKIDIICLLPLETVSSLIFLPCHFSLFRLPRLLKWHSVETFFLMSDYRTSKPNRLRASKLILYLSVAMHWVACLYYAISEYEGLGTNDWVYTETEKGGDPLTRKYVKSFYWSVLTLMTIGETPSPQTNLEYIFTGCMFLLGIFVFATVVGNVGDVISNMNAARTNFQARMDAIKQYMEHHNVPYMLQTRVKRWAHYAWSRTQALDEGASLEMLPERLRTEIAIHVHLDTLRKVKIFKDCEQGLLCELVLKLRPQIFSPGDYICRCGEIGREMYIINNGKVEVVIPDSNTGEEVVVASLTEGNYFGEISLLRLDAGKNRRSADVRSVGYSELLCLSQKDLMEAIEEYPEAKKVLESQGRDRLQRTRSNNNLSIPHPDSEREQFRNLEFNFAREISIVKELLEEIKENKNEFCKDEPVRSLREECLNLRIQIETQMEEIEEIKQQLALRKRSPNEEKSRKRSSAEAKAARRLIDKVISAAKEAASHNSTRTFQERDVDNESQLRTTENELRPRNGIARHDVPDIFVENDVDGRCYLGPRRRSLFDDNNND